MKDSQSKKMVPEINPELYERFLEESKRFVDENDGRIFSTDLPFRLLERWQLPVGRTDNERQQILSWLQSGEQGVLLQLPWNIFLYVCARRYPEVSADPDAVRRRFDQFQLLIRYIYMLYMIRALNRMRRFDLFEIEAYDELVDRIFEDLRDGTLPRVNYRPFL